MIPHVSNRLRTVLDGFRIVPAYVLLGLLKHLVPLRSLAKWTWCEKAGPRDPVAERRLTANVLRLSKLLRIADRDCLQRSLLLYRLLSAVGADPELVVGFREQDGKIIGHAWVLVDDVSIVEPESDLVRFAPVLRFGARGALLSQVRTGCEPKTLAR
jgi:transglutaminase superfamily protein